MSRITKHFQKLVYFFKTSQNETKFIDKQPFFITKYTQIIWSKIAYILL